MAKIQTIRVSMVEKFQALLEVRHKIEALELREAELLEALLPIVKKEGEVRVCDTSFVFTKRSKWEYTAKVSELEGALAARKKFEQEQGKARQVPGAEFITVKEDRK